MKIWLTADTHFDHKNIIHMENRPFNDYLHMTEELIENWNSSISEDDLVFHLGDVFFCNASRMKYISERLNGRKILIKGNHDYRFTNSKFEKLGFKVYNYYILNGYLLSHYPQHLAPMKVAMEKGLLKGNIHGHVHSNIDGLDQSIYKCVSVELTDYKPVLLENMLL
jgi:calcineurin-like phosphoesterase family protein